MSKLKNIVVAGLITLGIGYAVNFCYQADIALNKMKEVTELIDPIVPTVIEYNQLVDDINNDEVVVTTECNCLDSYFVHMATEEKKTELKQKIDDWTERSNSKYNQLAKEVRLANARAWNPFHGRF